MIKWIKGKYCAANNYHRILLTIIKTYDFIQKIYIYISTNLFKWICYKELYVNYFVV